MAPLSVVLDEVPGAYIFLGAHPGPVTDAPPTNHSARRPSTPQLLADQAASLAHFGLSGERRAAA